MDYKKIFGENPKEIAKRIALTIAFFVVVEIITILISPADAYFSGLPLPYSTLTFRSPSGESGLNFYPHWLLVDIIFWYAISSLILYKVKK